MTMHYDTSAEDARTIKDQADTIARLTRERDAALAQCRAWRKEAEANDPKKLRERIEQLEDQLRDEVGNGPGHDMEQERRLIEERDQARDELADMRRHADELQRQRDVIVQHFAGLSPLIHGVMADCESKLLEVVQLPTDEVDTSAAIPETKSRVPEAPRPIRETPRPIPDTPRAGADSPRINRSKDMSKDDTQIADPWIVHVKGSADRDGEISVLRESNTHGQRSYGWFGSDKHLIAGGGGPCEYTYHPHVWARHLATAKSFADELNAVDAAVRAGR